MTGVSVHSPNRDYFPQIDSNHPAVSSVFEKEVLVRAISSRWQLAIVQSAGPARLAESRKRRASGDKPFQLAETARKLVPRRPFHFKTLDAISDDTSWRL